MSAHPHSVTALHAQQVQGRLGRRASQILAWLRQHGAPATDRQIMEGLGALDPNYVRPRITELLAAGYLQEKGGVRDSTTGQIVRVTALCPRVQFEVRQHEEAGRVACPEDGGPLPIPCRITRMEVQAELELGLPRRRWD